MNCPFILSADAQTCGGDGVAVQVLGSRGPQLQVLFSLDQSEWCNIEADDSSLPRCLRDCPHVVTQPAPWNQDIADQRTVSGNPGKERRRWRPFVPRGITQQVAFIPIGHGYRLHVAGWEFAVATPALLFAFCFPARWRHELWSNRIRNRLLQDTIDFNIVLGGQLPSVRFFHTLQLFG
jgi:hypothetical protein